MTEIICYTGGTCGDMIAALIDPLDIVFCNGAVLHVSERTRLKKPHTFANDDEKDQYLAEVDYLAIPSHDLNYHVTRNHSFISTIVTDMKTALWAATRFKQLHRPHVWEEMSRVCGAGTVKDYAQMLIDYSNMVQHLTNRTISVKDIRDGLAVEKLQIGRAHV